MDLSTILTTYGTSFKILTIQSGKTHELHCNKPHVFVNEKFILSIFEYQINLVDSYTIKNVCTECQQLQL